MKWRYEHPELVVEWLDDKDIVCLSGQDDYFGEDGGEL